jgi:hypothetical protein
MRLAMTGVGVHLAVTGVSGAGWGPTICASIRVFCGSTCLWPVPTAPTPGDKTSCNVGRGQTWDGPRREIRTAKARRHEDRGSITGSSWVTQAVMARRAKRFNECAQISISGQGQRSSCLCGETALPGRGDTSPDGDPTPSVGGSRQRPHATWERTDDASLAGDRHGAMRFSMTGVAGSSRRQGSRARLAPHTQAVPEPRATSVALNRPRSSSV